MSTAGRGRVVIVGAGLVGCLAACYLSRRGYTVEIYERRGDPRAGGAERGRSINLALSERGLDALRRIDLEESVMAPALPMVGRAMHSIDGVETFQSYSNDGQRAINSISRSALNETLLDAAEASPGVSVHFEMTLQQYNVETGSMTFEGPNGKKHARAAHVIGADGWRSQVRDSLVQAGVVTTDSQMLDYSYKELTIPAVNGEFALRPDALHIWPRGVEMLIALPNPDKSFTCTLFWPKSQFEALTSPEAVQAHFDKFYADAVPLIPNLLDDYEHNPIGILGTIHTSPWVYEDKVALIGDAAHAILPFFGQGANCGFEDVVELDRCLDETGDDWAKALGEYNERRFMNAEAIALMAQENFIEMRDKVGSQVFLATKKVEHAVERIAPAWYTSRYEMVSFSTIPYAEVLEKSQKQQRMLKFAGVAAGAVIAAAAIGAVAVGKKGSS